MNVEREPVLAFGQQSMEVDSSGHLNSGGHFASGLSRKAFAVIVLLAVSASVGLHAALLSAFLSRRNVDLGEISAQTQAISIEVVPSDVIETSEADKSADGAAAEVAAHAGATEQSVAAVVREPPQVDVVKEAPPEPVRPEVAKSSNLPSGEPQAANDPGAEPSPVEKPTDIDLPAQAAPPEAKPSPETGSPSQAVRQRAKPKVEAESSHRKAHRENRPKGGVAARSEKAVRASRGRASASSGSIRNYAAIVRARVASNRPGGVGRSGTVVIEFGVSSSGRLAFARVMRSSGASELDRRALSAVRAAAPFPSPPAGAAPSQLRFNFYFQFN